MNKFDCHRQNPCGKGVVMGPCISKNCSKLAGNLRIKTELLPAPAGTDEPGQPFAPKLGAYTNTIVTYSANGAIVFYDSRGIWTKIQDAEVRQALEEEIANRKEADEALSSELTKKILEVADNLQTNINLEVMAREQDRDNLQANINKEVEAREAVDLELRQAQDETNVALREETAAREEADSGLQEQIDAIVDSTDVKDVVDTYADLQAYDKSTLGDNDIIKVLQDETHDGAISYYRYVKADNDFKFVGSIGPYYTKAESDNKFSTIASVTKLGEEVSSNTTAIASKQDKLVSGETIKTINGESLLGEGDLALATESVAVKDSVITYADLQAYDISKLTSGDVVVVIQDETHDGATSYYRYIEAPTELISAGLQTFSLPTSRFEISGNKILAVASFSPTRDSHYLDINNSSSGVDKFTVFIAPVGHVPDYIFSVRGNEDIPITDNNWAHYTYTKSILSNNTAYVIYCKQSGWTMGAGVGFEVRSYAGELTELPNGGFKYIKSGGIDSRLTDTGATKANHLPASLVEKFINASGSTNGMNVIYTKNNLNGITQNLVLLLPNATNSSSGCITGPEKVKLNALANIKTIGSNLTLSEEGELSANGGSNAEPATDTTAGIMKLYADYGTNIDGTVTQNFLNTKLNSGKVAIGTNADVNFKPSSASGYPNGHIAIGYNATARGLSSSGDNRNASIAIGYRASSGHTSGSMIQGNSIAIGNTAKAEEYGAVSIGGSTTSNYSHSIALGDQSVTRRQGELSIGKGDAAQPTGLRYIANVRDGVLPQDAVTVNQLTSAVAGTVLYTGSASTNSITLSEAATLFSMLEIHGEMTQAINGSSIVISKIVRVALENSVNGFKMEDIVVDPTANSVMLTTDIWSLSADKTEIDLARAVSVTTTNGTTTFATEPTSHFIITKIIGIGKKS